MAVRIAQSKDADAILDIYRPYVLTSTCTFETVVPTLEQMERRLTTGLIKFPWIVYQHQNGIGGYVYASTHRERDAYRWTCECSVYVHDDWKGKGIGLELYKALFGILKLQGLVNVFAGITLPNNASTRLHEKCGFIHFAVYENIGFKLGKWQKVGWWRLQLKEYELQPTPPILFSELDPAAYSSILQSATQNINQLMV